MERHQWGLAMARQCVRAFTVATKFAEDFRQLTGYLVVVEFKQRFGGIRSKTHWSGKAGDRPFGELRLAGTWFFDGQNGGHFKVLGQFGQDGLVTHPHDQFGAQPHPTGTQVGRCLEGIGVDACHSRESRRVGIQNRGSRIHAPTAASSTRNRGWSCTRRFRRNQAFASQSLRINGAVFSSASCRSSRHPAG